MFHVPFFTKRIIQPALRNTRYVDNKPLTIGLMGVIGFPLYYFIWQYLFPQPYENLTLRLVGCALFVPFIVLHFTPPPPRRYLEAYWLFVILYTFPFFFTYMTLMNDASTVWGMSTMTAITLMFFLIEEWLLLVGLYLLGSSAGWVTYYLVSGKIAPPTGYIEQLPIYIFILVLGSLFSHMAQRFQQERLRITLSIASSIGHELRTPLLGIRSGARGLRAHLPKLLETYHIAQQHQLDTPKLRSSHIKALETLTYRLEAEAEFSNNIIDILLMNSGNLQIDTGKFRPHSVTTCINTAVDRYPFQSPLDRQKITVKPGQDFMFFGSDVLFIHVIFNLIKNALESISVAGKGEISIEVRYTPNKNHVIFRDSGKGIDAATMAHIYKPFYTTVRHGRGTGNGLSFCRDVMESFGGSIRASSVPGEYTEFTLTFKETSDV